MMRSLYSGVTGLRNHQTRMDVIGNNIANVNTVGFKASRVTFSDIYSETIRPGTATTDQHGGMNPMQIGLGMTVQSIDVMHGRSAAQLTSMPLDVSISGDGFFAVSVTGTADPTSGKVPLLYTRAGNFQFDAPTSSSSQECNLLDANGYYVMGYEVNDPTNPSPPTFVSPSGEEPQKIVVDFAKYDNVSIDANGAVQARDKATDKRVVLFYLCTATFSNPQGLEKAGGNLYTQTPNSGEAMKHIPGSQQTNGGVLTPGSLEMSNVDIAAQFTDMIVTQRGFQANSRIITVSDQMLEELVNIKR